MFGSLILILVVAGIVGGVAVWVRRSRFDQAEDDDVRPDEPRRISLLTEAVGYIGTILLLAGATAAVGQRWHDISTAGRLAFLGGASVLFLAVGAVVRSSGEPAFRRLTGVTWAVSVVAFGGCAAVIEDSIDAAARPTFLVIVTTSTAYAGLLWLVHRHAIQHALVFAGLLLSAAAVVTNAVDEVDSWMIAVPLWAIGVCWAAAGWWRRLDPWFVAVPLGLLAALIAPAAIDVSGARYGLGIATAAAVMALAVIGRFTPGLAMSAVAMLGYVIGAVTYYFGDTLGIPASLSIAGLLILIMVAVAMRLHWFSRHEPPPPPKGGGGQGHRGSRRNTRRSRPLRSV